MEKLHEILSQNPAGVFVVRDELTGWVAGLDRQGREGERSFYLQAWNGDSGFTVDRIGRGSVYVPAACVSLFGNIQPARLRSYLSEVISGGPNDDGLFQRFQIIVWPDPSRTWKNIDRQPNAVALKMAEDIFVKLVGLPHDPPIALNFSPDAQLLFNEWLEELEHRVRSEHGLSGSVVGHLAKYRKLMPALAGLFEVADRQELDERISISLDHARQAAAWCEYLESHALRVYGCVESPECHAARELARHLQARDLPDGFRTRDVYLKGWNGLATPERARSALQLLAEAEWISREEPITSGTGGRPSESWLVNPRIHHEK